MYYFYILQSLKNAKLYLGFTPNLKGRLISHNKGDNKSTKPYIPYKLIYYSAFISKIDALECEKYFKTTSGWRRIKNMLKHSIYVIEA